MNDLYVLYLPDSCSVARAVLVVVVASRHAHLCTSVAEWVWAPSPCGHVTVYSCLVSL